MVSKSLLWSSSLTPDAHDSPQDSPTSGGIKVVVRLGGEQKCILVWIRSSDVGGSHLSYRLLRIQV